MFAHRDGRVCGLLFLEDVMGGTQHDHISKVIAQSEEPEDR